MDPAGCLVRGMCTEAFHLILRLAVHKYLLIPKNILGTLLVAVIQSYNTIVPFICRIYVIATKKTVSETEGTNLPRGPCDPNGGRLKFACHKY